MKSNNQYVDSMKSARHHHPHTIETIMRAVDCYVTDFRLPDNSRLTRYSTARCSVLTLVRASQAEHTRRKNGP